ncbi:antitoxin [Spirochaetia bacterium]|nr:antitoxin [Spirochaetia bacterium]
MTTAKLFNNGKSQAVRLPKEFRFEGKDVSVKKLGNIVLLYKSDNDSAWNNFLNSPPASDDFFANGRGRDDPQIRESL